MVPSQYDRSDKLVGLIHGVFGFHPTFRAVHAVGNIYRGTFTATADAKKYTRAAHFQGAAVPVTVRFSGGAGNPDAAPNTTAGMATKFYLPDGRVTDLIGLNAPTFVARTVDEVVNILDAAQPDPSTGQPDIAKVRAYAATVPTTAAALALRAQVPAPVSFAQTSFHAIHVFRYLNADGELHHVKCHWTPDAGQTGQTVEQQRRLPHDYLVKDMNSRIELSPVNFTLWIEIGEPGDPLNDPTALWPAGRRQVEVGHLMLVAQTSLEEIGDPIMLHDPTRITDGIELTDDPIIEARRGAYDASVAMRTGGWHSCPFAKVAGAPQTTGEG